MNKKIGKCYVDIHKYSEAIPFFENHQKSYLYFNNCDFFLLLILSTVKSEQKVTEMENRISRTKDLLRYSIKYENEKKQFDEAASPELKINFLGIHFITFIFK